MILLRSIVAVVLGFLAILVTVMIGTVLIAMATGVGATGHPTPLYLVLNIALCAPTGALGGWVCRRLAPVNPSRFVWVLAFLVSALGVVSALRPEPGQPPWYGWVIAPLGGLSVALGGRAWKRP